MKSHSQVISEYIAGLKYEDIPRDVIEQAKKVLLHTVAASMAAAPLPITKKVTAYTQSKGGAEEATIWCSDGRKVPAEEAAFANGTIADGMDWEDCTWTGHPSAIGIPACVAVAEKWKKSGKDLLVSIVAAYEGSQRIAMAAQPTAEYVADGREWGLVSWQLFAASMGAAKLMGLDAKQMEQVLGASLYQATVPINKHGDGPAKSDIYHYQHGFTARNGIYAAEVTRRGFDNCWGALDGKDGYWKMVSDQQDESWYGKDLGKLWLIKDSCYLKHRPANMWVQIPLEALADLLKEHPFEMDQVEKIRVKPNMPFIMSPYKETTKGFLDAQFSIPYCLTALMMHPEHRLDAGSFSDKMRHNEKLIAFCEKYEGYGETTTFFHNFEIFKTGSFPVFTIDITLKDGTELHKSCQFPKGHPQNNYTLEEEYDHYRKAAAPYLPAEQIERMIAVVDKLEEQADIGELAALTVIKNA